MLQMGMIGGSRGWAVPGGQRADTADTAGGSSEGGEEEGLAIKGRPSGTTSNGSGPTDAKLDYGNKDTKP